MDDPWVRLVAEQLRIVGLVHEAFDADEIAGDLADRTALNDSLDELIAEAGPEPDPIAFDLRWGE